MYDIHMSVFIFTLALKQRLFKDPAQGLNVLNVDEMGQKVQTKQQKRRKKTQNA